VLHVVSPARQIASANLWSGAWRWEPAVSTGSMGTAAAAQLHQPASGSLLLRTVVMPEV